MFTGLTEGIGKVKEIQRVRGDMRLTLVPQFDMSDSREGDSIAVNGVCLSITGIEGGAFSMDVSGETMSRSTMGQLKPGDEVNLERALRLGDRLGGHLVSGHVDGVGKILKKEQKERSWLLRIGIDEALARYTIAKGSIAVEGISLTINDCQDTYFEVNIIPHTAQETTILKRRLGDLVNIETDIIGKYVEKFFRKESSSPQAKSSSVINEEMLRKYGFGD
ncbi:MAG: riboflavin synthase [Deltaproteobacteria bacterium]|nr:MAG: riboflavin synthase [Deltaproteobacteria bacterium]